MLQFRYCVILQYPKGKEETKIEEFWRNIGGAQTCTKRIINTREGQGQLSANCGLFNVIYFSGAKTVEEANAEGFQYCGPVNTSHRIIFLATLEKSMKY